MLRKIKIKTVFLLLISSNLCNAQLMVDLGDDTTYCIDLFAQPTSYLGEYLKIENGIEPIEFSWHGSYRFNSPYSPTFWASTFLNDTTSANPYFIDYPIGTDWLKLILTVKDSENQVASDSINVRFSDFAYYIFNYDVYLKFGDSIQFDGIKYIAGGIPPLSFRWEPIKGLSDPNSLFTWCKPDSSIDYYQIATDSIGCVSNPNLVFQIRMIPTVLDEKNADNNNNQIKLYQSGSKIYFQNPDRKKALLSIFALNGDDIFVTKTNEGFFDIDQLMLETGIYIINVNINQMTGSVKFIKY